MVRFFFIVFILGGYSCSNPTSKKNESPTFQNHFNCPTNQSEYDNLTSYSAKNNSFLISFPSRWAITKTVSDTIVSVVGGDTSLLNQGIVKVLTVTEQNLFNRSLDEAFQTEKMGLKNDPVFTIVAEGSYNNHSLSGFWVEVDEQHGQGQLFKNMMVYLSDARKDKLYIIHFTYSDAKGFNTQVCSIQSLISTFRSNHSDSNTNLAYFNLVFNPHMS